jgi:hypothetical protein
MPRSAMGGRRMIQLENPTLPCADAGPVSAALSKNPMSHHACGGIMGHQMAKSCWENKPANAARRQNPARSAHQTLQP